jgi:hypothetical protein
MTESTAGWVTIATLPLEWECGCVWLRGRDRADLCPQCTDEINQELETRAQETAQLAKEAATRAYLARLDLRDWRLHQKKAKLERDGLR